MNDINIIENYNLKELNTFKVDVDAGFFCPIHSKPQLLELLTHHSSLTNNFLVLGGGSNILFTKNYPGLVIKNEIKGIDIIDETANYIFIKVGAGENWHNFVMFCVENHYAGIENLALIPGNIGAAPIQNIGAYGSELKLVFHSLEAVHIHSKQEKSFYCEDCHFGYRDSIFKKELKGQYIITHVILRLHKKPQFNIDYGSLQRTIAEMGVKNLTIQAISQAVMKIRKNKLPDPKEIPNAGSFFKNPILDKHTFQKLLNKFPDIPFHKVDNEKIKIPAAWLIDKNGWKGKRIGNVGVHDQQALVIINHNQASGSEILNFSKKIQESIKNQFDIYLEPEVNII